MKFVPKQADAKVNISKTHPLIEMAWLAGGLFLLIALVYLTLTLMTGWLVKHMPLEAEVWLGKKILMDEPGTPSPVLEKRLKTLIASLPPDSPLHQYKFSVHILKTDKVNAVALPGGTIVVFSGLLKEVGSENELSMILAHELGHYAHRDHLKRLGKGIVLGALSWVLFRNSSQPLLFSFISGLDARYSQSQEEKADLWGLDLLYKRYGHVGGATDFFERLLIKAKAKKFEYLLASHPYPGKRIKKIIQRAKEKGYPIYPTQPLGEDIKRILKGVANEKKK